MLDRFIFENHLGLRFDGLENGVYLNYNELRDYSWSYETINNKISRFHRPITSRKLPLTIYCDSEEKAVAVKNRLFELAEADISAKLPGKIYIGEYYTVGYITGSTKNNYLITKRLCEIELTFTTDDPTWYKEQTYTFIPTSDNAVGVAVGGGTDYPYDYTYDFALSLMGQRITCDSVGDNAFRLLIYGATTDPTITINGHAYTVNGSVGNGETLLIDSLNKTVTLTTALGNKINWFDKRSRESYIFEPISAGQNTVSWSGTFGFDLTVIEKRSEPRWT